MTDDCPYEAAQEKHRQHLALLSSAMDGNQDAIDVMRSFVRESAKLAPDTAIVLIAEFILQRSWTVHSSNED